MTFKRGFIDGEYQDGELRGLVFLAGKRGYGKTTEMVRLLSLCRGPWLFFDSLSKHDLKGCVRTGQPGDLKECLRLGYNRILYQPRSGSLLEHFEAVNAIVYAVGSMIYAVDEIDMHTTASQLPPRLYDLVNYGRHSRVSMVFTARRPAQVARELTAACSEMRLFTTTENRDVRYFAEYIGDNNALRLRSLPRFHYLLWRDDIDPQVFCSGRPQK